MHTPSPSLLRLARPLSVTFRNNSVIVEVLYMIMAPYYVAAKNLSTRQMSVMSTEGFYIAYDDNSYEDFQPGNITDFVEKSHYGRIQGEWMLLYYIIGMEGKSPSQQNPLVPRFDRLTVRKENVLTRSWM